MAKLGKPVDLKLRAQREQAILDAAIESLTRVGYGGMRMDAVARAAGISKASIYRHFDSKESLLKGVVVRVVASVLERLTAVTLDRERTYAQRLAMFLDVAYDSILNTPMGHLLPVMAETASQYPELAKMFATQVRLPLDYKILTLIREGIAAGEFREHPAADQIPVLMGPLMAFSLQRSLLEGAGIPPADSAACQQAHLGMLLDALLVTRP